MRRPHFADKNSDGHGGWNPTRKQNVLAALAQQTNFIDIRSLLYLSRLSNSWQDRSESGQNARLKMPNIAAVVSGSWLEKGADILESLSVLGKKYTLVIFPTTLHWAVLVMHSEDALVCNEISSFQCRRKTGQRGESR